MRMFPSTADFLFPDRMFDQNKVIGICFPLGGYRAPCFQRCRGGCRGKYLAWAVGSWVETFVEYPTPCLLSRFWNLLLKKLWRGQSGKISWSGDNLWKIVTQPMCKTWAIVSCEQSVLRSENGLQISYCRKNETVVNVVLRNLHELFAVPHWWNFNQFQGFAYLTFGVVS